MTLDICSINLFKILLIVIKDSLVLWLGDHLATGRTLESDLNPLVQTNAVVLVAARCLHELFVNFKTLGWLVA